MDAPNNANGREKCFCRCSCELYVERGTAGRTVSGCSAMFVAESASPAAAAIAQCNGGCKPTFVPQWTPAGGFNFPPLKPAPLLR